MWTLCQYFISVCRIRRTAHKHQSISLLSDHSESTCACPAHSSFHLSIVCFTRLVRSLNVYFRKHTSLVYLRLVFYLRQNNFEWIQWNARIDTNIRSHSNSLRFAQILAHRPIQRTIINPFSVWCVCVCV